MLEDPGKMWRLSANNNWGADLSAGVELRVESVRPSARRLVLATGIGGPMDPAAARETVGGLTLPAEVAVISGEVLLAVKAENTVLGFDLDTREMVPRFSLKDLLPVANETAGLVIAGSGDLLLAARRGESNVIAISMATGTTYDKVELPHRYRIRDMCASGRLVVILAEASDRSAVTLWMWKPGRDDSLRSSRKPVDDDAGSERLLVDKRLNGYIFHAGRRELARFDAFTGDTIGPWSDLELLRDAFPPLVVVIEPDAKHEWRMRVPVYRVADGKPLDFPLTWPAFSPEGIRLEIPPEAPTGSPPYQLRGTLEVGPLDSGTLRTQWDRIFLEVESLPPGTKIEVATKASDYREEIRTDLIPWSTPHLVASLDGLSPVGGVMDFAVLSGRGRFLAVQMRLHGGSDSPAVKSLSLSYPRKGLMQYLPTVYAEADEDTRFLQRFLGAFESTWRPLDNALDDVHLELRPGTAGAEMLGFLASWFAEPLAPEWGTAARRRTVADAAARAPRRGTPEAVQSALALYVANRWNTSRANLGGVPLIWEHFRSRAFLRLSPENEWTEAGGAGVLFGEEILNRLRMGKSRLGEGRLRDLGSPHTDPVTIDANRFSVFVPTSLVPDKKDVQGLSEVLDRERPAHTVATIELVEPRLRVGEQATLGVDTALGSYPEGRLATEGAGQSDETGARLNYDCILARIGREPADRPSLGPGRWIPLCLA